MIHISQVKIGIKIMKDSQRKAMWSKQKRLKNQMNKLDLSGYHLTGKTDKYKKLEKQYWENRNILVKELGLDEYNRMKEKHLDELEKQTSNHTSVGSKYGYFR